jgi:hypothetical protein
LWKAISRPYRFHGNRLYGRLSEQRGPHRTLNDREHQPGILEANFRLGWMHIDIHTLGRHFDEDQRNRIAANHKKGVIGLCNCRSQTHVLNPAPIHKERDFSSVGSIDKRCSHEPGHRDPLTRGFGDWDHLLRYFQSIDLGEYLQGITIAVALQLGSSFSLKFKAATGVGHGIACLEIHPRSVVSDFKKRRLAGTL